MTRNDDQPSAKATRTGVRGVPLTSKVTPYERLTASSITEEGLRWALDRLDPAASHCVSPGIPDRVSAPRMVYPFKVSTTVSSNGLGLKDTETWDLAFVVLPLADRMGIMVKKKSSDPWPTTFGRSFTVDSTPAKDVTDLDSVPFDSNTNLCEGFWRFPSTAAGGDGTSSIANRFRIVSRSLTSNLIGPNLYRSGMVTSGQVAPEIVPFNTENFTAPNPLVTQRWIRTPMFDPSSILTSDRLAGQRPANDGDYTVIRGCSVTGVNDLSLTNTGILGFFDSSVPFDQLSSLSVIGLSIEDVLSEGSNMATVVYSGLNSQDVVRLKACSTIELYPIPGSIISTLSTANPRLDQAAIDLVTEIEDELPHSYPADYNDLGGLLGVIGGFFKKIGVPVARIVGGMGLPIVSPIASALGDVASHFGW